MQSKINKTFDVLVAQFVGKRLPDEMAASFSMSKLTPDAQDFIIRMLSQMKRAGYSVTGFNPHLILWLSATVPSTLPGAYGARIPPLTFQCRHKNLDNNEANLKKNPPNQPKI